MGKLGWIVGVMALLGACDDNRNVAVSNTNPLGVVGGRVLDLDGEAALPNAMVTLESAGATMMAMTDMTGTYTFGKVPAGDFFLTIGASGYESAYIPGTLSGAVGNFPVSNPQATVPTVELFKTDTTFAVALVDDRGAPVMGVPVTARPQVKYFAYDYPYGTGGSSFPTLMPFGQYAVSATSDANGVATFVGLPTTVALNMINVNSTEMYIDVPPITITGSTTYRWAGASFALDPTRVTQPGGFPGSGPVNTVTIPLVGPNTPLAAVASSVDYLVTKMIGPVASVVPTDKPLSITFNQAVDDKTLRAQLLDENGVSLGDMTPTFAAGNIVQLAPPAAFMAGKRYNLVLHADPLSYAGNGGTPLNVTAPFFTAGSAALSVTAALTTLPLTGLAAPTVGKIVLLSFSEPVGLGKGLATALPCVAWYETIDLDNSGGTVSYQGEYSATSPQACPNPTGPIGFDVTRIVPMEPAPSPAMIPATGFASKWWVQVDDTTATGGCKGGTAAACTRPGAGTTMHLLFSHLDSTETLTRPGGQPIGDLMVAIQ
jgi:hypothetical protein